MITKEELRKHCIKQIEQCEKWAKHMGETHVNSKVYEEHKLILELLEQEQKWIPVSERLPEPFQNILVTCEAFHWVNEPIRYVVEQKSFNGIVDFIAWMPLPEPYKVESEDKE